MQKIGLRLAAALMLLAPALPVAAQDDPVLAGRGVVAPDGAVAAGEPRDAFGGTSQELWISPNEFHRSGTEVWSYNTFLFYSISAGATGVGLVKQLTLDTGARVTGPLATLAFAVLMAKRMAVENRALGDILPRARSSQPHHRA